MVTFGLRRTYMLAAVRRERVRLVQEFDRYVRAIANQSNVSNHRINGIVNSLAWHARRKTEQERLTELGRELRRLRAKVEAGGSEDMLYQRIQDGLGLETLEPFVSMQWEDKALIPLRLAPDEREEWQWRVRLLLAQDLIQIVQLLMRSEQMRREIEEQGGAIQWL